MTLTSSGNGGLDEGVELLVSANGELEMAGSDTLHLQVLGCVSGELENLSKLSINHEHIHTHDSETSAVKYSRMAAE